MGHGVEPDIVIDNLPHATFAGEDAQLKAALELLKREISSDPWAGAAAAGLSEQGLSVQTLNHF
jgi:C-terminal processing protease CtpA/Prc